MGLWAGSLAPINLKAQLKWWVWATATSFGQQIHAYSIKEKIGG